MDNATWQLVLAGILVAGAVWFLARRVYRLWRGMSAGGCGTGGCDGCGPVATTIGDKQQPLVQLRHDGSNGSVSDPWPSAEDAVVRDGENNP